MAKSFYAPSDDPPIPVPPDGMHVVVEMVAFNNPALLDAFRPMWCIVSDGACLMQPEKHPRVYNVSAEMTANDDGYKDSGSGIGVQQVGTNSQVDSDGRSVTQ